MMQITEDTPPDMLAGAMDLTVHLPGGKAVKMSVERGTPMMDLLVQITTANHLQLSNHTLQVLGMAPSSEHSDKILPFKPNTPIGALDTQHIRVLPKGRTLPAPKYVAPGHQPFESTFRLKVHLPRNQLYVTRVSRNVLLEDIMKKVCEEKNLDPIKYDFKHPGNLDEILDPKLTLSDYQITEIYVVAKGTTNLSQAFSAADIMVLRKEEERKQMHNKTGGGVFNLIFKRGKSSMGSGSVSSDNRSISPTHSDDSRSVTPPAVQTLPMAPPKKDPPPERPKPPQRKRRPAPKPPQIQVVEPSNNNDDKSSSVVSNEIASNATSKKDSENGLTICHSRNSSDSSGYHEASILSDHCANNTSLPRTRPKSAFVGDLAPLQSTSNLTKMSAHSRSTTSLIAGRKKKVAPPPPPVGVSPVNSVVAQSDHPSPLVASQSDIITTQSEFPEVLESTETSFTNPTPIPRPKPRNKAPKALPRPRPQSEIFTSSTHTRASPILSRLSYNEDIIEQVEREIEEKLGLRNDKKKDSLNRLIVDDVVKEALHQSDEENAVDTSVVELRKPSTKEHTQEVQTMATTTSNTETSLSAANSNETRTTYARLEFQLNKHELHTHSNNSSNMSTPNNEYSMEEILTSLEAVKPFIMNTNTSPLADLGFTDPLPKETDKESKASPKTTMLNLQQSVVGSIFNSDEFLKDSKPPEIVGVIPKTPKEEKKFSSSKDSFGKKRCFQIGSSLEQKYDPETASISSKRSGDSKSSRNSVASALNALDDEIGDLDENMFTGSLSKGATKKRPEVFNQLFGIHDYDPEVAKRMLRRDMSVGSLRSCDGSIPGVNSIGLSKWDNSEDLDSISVYSDGVRNRWVAGDASDTESVTSSTLTSAQIPLDCLPPCLETSTPVKTPQEEKSLDSTDSGIAHDTQSDREREEIEEDFIFHTPPPPPILDDLPVEAANIEKDIHTIIVAEPKGISTPATGAVEADLQPIVAKTITKEAELVVESANKTPVLAAVITPPLLATAPAEVNKVAAALLVPTIKKQSQSVDIEWQYQLPSPPKAFRDSSPANLIVNETNSLNDFKDSVVTSPELFEKLRTLEENQSEKDTLISEVTSIASEEPLNTLSLEHLEKRMSLVYNRELATSLKMTDNIETSGNVKETFASSLTGFQTAYNQIDKQSTSPPKQPSKPVRTSSHHHTLPNFKISTYDVPKHQNIKVFEDDTIRSNTQGAITTLNKSEYGQSMENISFAKRTSISDYSAHAEKEYKFYKPKPTQLGSNSVSRSGSFSTDTRPPLKPVSRSRSTLALNKYQVGQKDETNISRSNSLFDVSGLQSLEVMKLIQNKLSTPTGSVENINARDKPQSQPVVPQKPSPKVEIKQEEPPQNPDPVSMENQPQTPPLKPASPEPVKKYYYRGPPSVNMSTWSERPKVPVAVKEDADYKLGNVNNISSKLIVNTMNNNITSNNSIEVKNHVHVKSSSDAQNNEVNNRAQVSVNINGGEQITNQKSGNVLIKIGGGTTQNGSYVKNGDTQRFMGPVAYRKPFSNINRNDTGMNNKPLQRPHSIALSSDFDISRVPIVRSVELKKSYKDPYGTNTSITHLNQGNEFKSLHHYYDKSDSFAEKFRSTENLRSIEKQESEVPAGKRVFRVGSFKPLDNIATPTVRGFKLSNNNNNNNEINKRLSWNPSTTYNTLPAKPKLDRESSINQHVPFSQSTLRRTGSSKICASDQNSNDISTPVVPQHIRITTPTENTSYNSLPPNLNKSKMQVTPPPPPPLMPKVTLRKSVPVSNQIGSPTDPRDTLLESIRSFGGKKGLKTVKA